MSLQLIAKQMEAKGRKGDSMLVHMTPGEVAGLQQLAQSAGGSLTVNPETGLVEANFLKRILPGFIIPFAAGMVGGPLAAAAAGAMVGGVQAKENKQDFLTGALLGGVSGYGAGSLGAGLNAAGSQAAQAGAMRTAVDSAAANAANLAPTATTAMPSGLVGAGAGDLAGDVAAQEFMARQASRMGTEAGAQAIQQAADAEAQRFAAQGISDRAGQGISALVDQGSNVGRQAFMSKVGGGAGLMSDISMAAAAPMLAPGKMPGPPPVDDEMYEYDYDVGRTYAENTPSAGSGEQLYFDGEYSEPRKIKARDYQYAEGGIASVIPGLRERMENLKNARATRNAERDARNAERDAKRAAEKAARNAERDARNAARNPQPATPVLEPAAPAPAGLPALVEATPAAPVSTAPAATVAPAPAPFTTPTVNLQGPTGTLTNAPGALPTFMSSPAAVEIPNTMSGPSRSAFDYLMGKTSVSGPSMAQRPATTSGRIAAPSSSDMYTFDPATGTFTKNPNYVDPDAKKDVGQSIVNLAESGGGDSVWGTGHDSGSNVGPSYQGVGGGYEGSINNSMSLGAMMNAQESGMGGGVTGHDYSGGSGTTSGISDVDTSYGYGGYFAEGGILGLAKGGMASGGFVVPADVVSALGNGSTDAGLRSLNAMLGKAAPIKGKGDGLSDSIKTNIDGKQPARVADGEAYIDPKTVKRVGGAKKLYAMMDKIRAQAHGKTSQQRKVNPAKVMA